MQDDYKISFWLKNGSKAGLQVSAYSSTDAEKFARQIVGNDNITALAEFPTRTDSQEN